MPTCQVDTGNKVVNDALVYLAKKHGWKVDSTLKHAYYRWLGMKEGSRIAGNHDSCEGRYTTVSLSRFVALLEEGPEEPPIKINQELVKFVDDGIMVGCRFVPTATIDEVHARLHKPTAL